MSITQKEIHTIALLARLELTPDEAAKLTGHLESILNYVAQLNELDTSQVEPLTHVVPLQNVMREDLVTQGAPHSLILKNAPQSSGNLFRVPQVIE